MSVTTTVPRLIALEATISPGAFSGELLCELSLANRQTFEFIAPPHFCWDKEDKPIKKGELEEPITGKVAARYIEPLNSYDEILVELPYGPTVAVD